MRVREARRASLVGAFLLAVLVTIPTASAVSRPSLAGTVRSAVGVLVPDVEILVLRERGPDPVAVVRSDVLGRFHVPDLPIGTYRVVAVKDGYSTWLGRVTVALRTSLDLVLEPAVVDPTLDPDWVLRVPGRGLLRETTAIAMLEPPEIEVARGKGGPTVAYLEAERWVQGKIDHVFAFGADAVEGPRARLQGGETRMLLSSHPGERAQVRFEGRRQALDAPVRPDLGPRRSRENADLHLDVSYDTSLDGQLAVQAFYASRETDLAPTAGGQARAWGYDARWSRQLDPASRLAVEMAYLDTGLDPLATASAVPLAGRALGASTVYESRLGTRHQVRLGMRARSADLSALRLLSAEALSGPGGISVLAGVPDPLGWGLRLDAEDAVTVASPLTLVYGLGYEEDVTGPLPGLFAQRVGAVFTADDLVVDLRATRHALLASHPEAARRLQDPFGWSAAVEIPLPANLRLRGEALASPVHEDGLDRPLDGVVLERPLYLTDGMASTRQNGLTVQHQAQHTHAFLQVVRGSVDGMLAAVRPADFTVGTLDSRQLDFTVGRVGLRVVPTGTDLVAEYRRVLGDTAGTGVWTGATEAQSIEVRVLQDLVRLHSRGAAWRLLLAARATQEEGQLAEGTGDGTQHWMGAGISLAF